MDPSSDPFTFLLDSWDLVLHSRNLALRTRRTYCGSVRTFGAWLRQAGYPTDPAAITPAACQAWQIAALAAYRPATVEVARRAVVAWLAWLVQDGELSSNPMAGIPPPKLPPPTPPDCITRAEMQALLKACGGTGFTEKRDYFLLLLLYDGLLRHAELVALQLVDVHLDGEFIRITHGKGDKQRDVGLGRAALLAARAYLRKRQGHPGVALPALWLAAPRGAASPPQALGYTGVTHMINRRARQAGLTRHLYPHLFRHSGVDALLEAGAQEGDVATLAGWSDRAARAMLGRYGAARKTPRALQAHKKFSPGDRL